MLRLLDRNHVSLWMKVIGVPRLCIILGAVTWGLGPLVSAAKEPSAQSEAQKTLHRDPERFWSHPGTSLEWWYLTGPLWEGTDCDGATGWAKSGGSDPVLGAQLTFFYSGRGDRQGLVVHGAVSDLQAQKNDHIEIVEALPKGLTQGIFGRARDSGPGSGPDLALGPHVLAELASTPSSSLWLASWLTEQFEVRLALDVDPRGLWRHGRNGTVQKSPQASNTYVSVPFVPARGVVRERLTGNVRAVCGSLWFDHEVDVSHVDSMGWQWFALRFPDGRAYMIYNIRSRTETSASTAQTGSPQQLSLSGEGYRLNNGTRSLLTQLTVQEGPVQCLKSGRCYPQRFVISFREGTDEHTITVTSSFAEQEVDSAVLKNYWEGLVHIVDEKGQKGLGYGELTDGVRLDKK